MIFITAIHLRVQVVDIGALLCPLLDVVEIVVDHNADYVIQLILLSHAVQLGAHLIKKYIKFV